MVQLSEATSNRDKLNIDHTGKSTTFSLKIVMALKRADFNGGDNVKNLLGAGVLGHGLSAFRHGVLRQFSGKKQTNGSLDFPARDR